MTKHCRSIITVFMTLCVVLSAGSRSQAQGRAFKWEKMKYNGNEYVTLRSVKSFYYFQTIKYGKRIVISKRFRNKEGKMALLELVFSAGSQECRMNDVLFILSSPIVSKNGRYLLSNTDLVNLVDPVLRPTHIEKARPVRTVVVDAGHGGKDSGSRGYFSNEKVYTLKVARLLRDMLQKMGYRVVMTRDSDVFVSLSDRVRIANKYPNAIFLSIHFNSGNSRAHGIETFTISPRGVPHMGRGLRARDFNAVPGNIMGSASIALATAAHSRVFMYLNNADRGNNFKIKDRGIKRARFNVLTGIRIPAILLEGGFLSNRVEAQKIHSYAYQKMLASALARAVYVYSSSVSKVRRQVPKR